jgi:glucose-6-phosphate isomerase
MGSTLGIKIHFEDSLFGKELEYWVPHASTPESLARIKTRAESWTGNASNSDKIFSGYRRQILASEGLVESVALANDFRKKFSTLVVLGIGGSALGVRAIHCALGHTLKDARRIEVLDNLDPVEFERVFSSLDLARTAFAVISKAGGTLETMAQCSVVLERLKNSGLKTEDHVVAITDPSSGSLRAWVNDAKLKALCVPSDVGGRFSVFTPVGLFPLAFAGYDVAGLLRGAQSFFKGDVVAPDTLTKIAQRFSEYELEGFAGHVLMPYATVLKEFSAWFVQLWGESLGKETASGQKAGPIPVAAVGATDQHSILQLLVEGPNRIITGFVTVKDWNSPKSETLVMPKTLPSHFSKLSFAETSRFGRILEAQCKATQSVLTKRQRPTYHIELGRLDEAHLGALSALYMDLTTWTGAALEINPYNQPGVEEGKVILPSFF